MAEAIETQLIPKHWKEKSLGEIFTIERGGSPRPIEDFITNAENGINWIKIGDTKNVVKYISKTKEKIKPEGAKRSRMVYEDDFLLSNSMSFGRPYIMKTTGCIHDGWLVIRKNEIIDNNYLYYILSSSFLYQQFSNLAKGSTVKNLNIEAVKQAVIRFPPLPEQQAIVAKIEELLSELENGKQQLLTAQQKLKVYRQSLLKWAFEGKLTNKKVKDGELPKGWKWVKSGELFSFVTSGSRGWAKFYADKGAIFIRITNMNFGTLKLDLREEKIQYVNPPSNSEGIRTKVQEGDFLFSITGYLGMFAIAPKLENAFVNQHVCLCRPKDGFNKKYVGYWIISKSGGIHHLNKNQKGAVKAGLNLDDLKTFPVPICSIEEQQLIVSELEIKLTVCDKIEETISQSLQQAETLRQSILKMAFEGRLV
jgi:type I restriction enzyme S subunit